jgi:pilus assembly protein Flp/PilA
VGLAVIAGGRLTIWRQFEECSPRTFWKNFASDVQPTLDHRHYRWERRPLHGYYFFTEATLKRIIVKFLSDDSGATAIEYGLIAAGISLAIIAVVNGLGSNLNGMFSSINSSLK